VAVFNVIDVIESQHKQVKKLLSDIASGKGQKTEDDFCALRRMLAVHETAEEEIVYPAIRSTGGDGPAIAQRRVAEEEEGVEVLGRLEQLDVGSDEFRELFSKFREAVLKHATAEEEEVLPLLSGTQSKDRLEAMGKEFRRADEAVPEHDHPHGAGKGTVVAMPATEIAQRVRITLRSV
jgi:hemerythrin superfamily protein